MSGPGEGFQLDLPPNFAFDLPVPPVNRTAFQTGPTPIVYRDPAPYTGAQPAGAITHTDPVPVAPLAFPFGNPAPSTPANPPREWRGSFEGAGRPMASRLANFLGEGMKRAVQR